MTTPAPDAARLEELAAWADRQNTTIGDDISASLRALGRVREVVGVKLDWLDPDYPSLVAKIIAILDGKETP